MAYTTELNASQRKRLSVGQLVWHITFQRMAEVVRISTDAQDVEGDEVWIDVKLCHDGAVFGGTGALRMPLGSELDEHAVQVDHQYKLSHNAASKIAGYRAQRTNTAIIVGSHVRETNYGHCGTVVSIRQDAQVTWYTVAYATATKDIYSEHLACEIERVFIGWDKV